MIVSLCGVDERPARLARHPDTAGAVVRRMGPHWISSPTPAFYGDFSLTSNQLLCTVSPMRRMIRLVITLLGALAILAWVADALVNRTIWRWFERDVSLRAELAMSGAHEGLVEPWQRSDRPQMTRMLTRISRVERIMGAAACDCDLGLVASSEEYPAAFDCQTVGERVREADASSPGQWKWRRWSQVFGMPGGSVHVSAFPAEDASGLPLGFVILVQDMSYADRRGALTRQYTFAAFALLALCALLLTALVARWSWKDWTAQVRRVLRGGKRDVTWPEFQPILRDVRELVSQIVAESRAEGQGSAWTAERLRQTLHHLLHGERVIIVANREPYIHTRAEDGSVQVLHPASGLVTALEPVMRACSGVWIAHGSGSADREAADQNGRVQVPPGEESYTLKRVWLSTEEEKGYYYGFANEGLWPLCHIARAWPTFRSSDWAYYQSVNQKFTDAVCSEADSDDPIILVQDYHFGMAPRMIRERLPRATIITFWHVPWPNSERFGICPMQDELLQGMLGSSIIGFQTQLHCNNFLDAADRFLEARIDRESNGVVQGGRMTLVRPYPISIESPSRWIRQTPPVAECRAGVFDELGLPPDRLLGVGVDRLDYTKGIEERLLAVERLLERFPQFEGRFCFAQLAAPSRTAIERYKELNVSVRELAERINARFGRGSYRPITLLQRHHEPLAVFRYYRAADLCYVSSLHDGMNLVAKEFVSAREDDRGVLILSRFTGAARELAEALIVNPYDIEQASSALAAALTMSAEEQKERMRAMRGHLAEFNVYRWAGRMLVDAARLRQRDRVSDRLVDHLSLLSERQA